MAFIRKNFDPGPSPKGVPNIAVYETADAIAVVAAANYFDSVADQFKSVSFMLVKMSDATRLYEVAVSGATPPVVTLPKSVTFI